MSAEITHASHLTARWNIRTWHPQLYRENVWSPLERFVCTDEFVFYFGIHIGFLVHYVIFFLLCKTFRGGNEVILAC